MFDDFGYSEEKDVGKAYDMRLLRRLWPFIRPYWRLLAGAVVLILLITLLELALPYITKIAIDRYIVPETAGSSAPADTSRSISDKSDQTLFLRTDVSSPRIRPIIEKHKALFKQADGGVRIHPNDLNKLTKSEIQTLRRDDLQGVAWAALLFSIVIIFDLVLNFSQVMVMEKAGQSVMHDLRIRLFSHIQELSVSFFNRTPVARLVTRTTNDIQNMHELFTSIIVFLFKDLFLVLGIMIVMASINWRLALVCMALLPFVLISSLYFARLARDVFRIIRIKTAEINTRFSETIAGMKVIQLFREEMSNEHQFKTLNHEFYDAGMRQIHIFAVFMPLIELFSAVSLALVIYYGGSLVLSEHISLGVLVAFISYMRMFFRPIRDLSEKYNILQNAMSSAERIFLLLDETDKETDHPDAMPLDSPVRRIEFSNVHLSYIKGEPVLKDVSFHLEEGKTLAVVGPTGAGKTSLIHLLIRFYDPTEGEIKINQTPARQWQRTSLRSKIALVSQDPFLFSGTVRENITLGDSRLSGKKLWNVIDAAHCRSLIEKLPEGLDSQLSEGGASISSGERQLISIARAFAADPDVIIFDEATSYIDSETEELVQKAMTELMTKRTVIIIAHRLSTARNADTILVLRQGEIIESGSHSELMAGEGLYYNLFELQNRIS